MNNSIPITLNDVSEEDNTSINIGIYDVLLPCRRYRVTFKTAEVGKVSLTTEFLLRLIYTIDGMPESTVAQFFDFKPQEMTYLLNDAVSLGYINRNAGRLWLTTAGRLLFVNWDEAPQIYNVDTRTINIGFDMLSFSPEDKTWMESFDNKLPELSIDALTASNARELISTSFKYHFSEIISQRSSIRTARKSLYSIDEVVPTERFASIIPVIVKSSRTNPAHGEPDLLEWRTEEQLENRTQITSAVARFVDELIMDRPHDYQEHYKILHDLAPKLMQEYINNNEISIERYYNDVTSLKGAGFRRNRLTVPIIGPLINSKTTKLFLDGLKRTYANSQVECIPSKFYWKSPSHKHWGLSRLLPKLCHGISTYLAEKMDEGVPSPIAVLIQDTKTNGVKRAFSEILEIKKFLPSSIEILLIPGLIVAVLVHLPINTNNGHAVPLGFISIDFDVITKTEKLLQEVTPIELPNKRVTEQMIDFL